MSDCDILFNTKIKTACSRCDALKAQLTKYRSRGQVSPAIIKVVIKLQTALDAIKIRLASLPNNPDVMLYESDEREKVILLTSRYIVIINNLAALIENSDASSVPAEVALPLRRIVRTMFSRSELIVVASPEINYSVMEICQYLQSMLGQLQCKIETDFPERIFRIAVPLVKGNHALQYPILAHEVGHHLFELNNVFKAIEPVNIKLDKLTDWLKARQKETPNQGTEQTELPLDEVTLRDFLTRPVNDMVSLWIREVASDMYGLILMGPAFIMALLSLSLPVLPIDKPDPDHPPIRFRLRVLLKCMKILYGLESFSPNLRKAIESWTLISCQEIKGLSLLEDIVLSNLDNDPLINRLWDKVLESTNSTMRYSVEAHSTQVKNVLELLDAGICPVSYIDNGNDVYPEVASVLNAGWETFLGNLETYRSCLPDRISQSQQLVEESFDALLLKALELKELAIYWRESSHGAIGENN